MMKRGWWERMMEGNDDEGAIRKFICVEKMRQW